MDKCLLKLLIIIILPVVFSSCEKNNNYIQPPLIFSEDTIHFDTVFTTAGSTTREFKVYNPGKADILIDEIFLSGGQDSYFRLNIDGEPIYRKENVTLDSGDSIFIFVDAIVDPLNVNTPVALTDSIVFRVSGVIMQVQLLAWGQDVFLLENATIGSETWKNTKPYLIYGKVILDTAETLIIEAGVRVYFHKKASLTIAGNIEINGSFSNPVLLSTDRLEKEYDDVPGLWEGVFILGTSQGNSISYAIVENSTFGLQVGEPVSSHEKPDIKLFYTNISHSSVTALSAVNATIEAASCIFSHCGKYCIYLASGGDYIFSHCTVNNQWEYGFRMTPALTITEKPLLPNGLTGQMNFDLNNSVIYGDAVSEIQVYPLSKDYSGSYYFDHCLLKLDTARSDLWMKDRFLACQFNSNPKFIDPYKYDYRPDTLSPLIDKGNPLYSASYQLDFRGADRTKDGKPDIGAYERIPGETRAKR